MASGTISFSTSNEYIDGRIVWTSTANLSTNQSVVTCTLSLRKDSTYDNRTYGTLGARLTINGVAHNASVAVSLYGNTWNTIITASETVTHNTDGTKSISLSATVTDGVGSLTSFSGASGTAVLDSIPRGFEIKAGDGTWHYVDVNGSRIKANDGAWHAINSMYIRTGTGWEQIF